MDTTVKRQLNFPTEVYSDATHIMNFENTRKGTFTRKDKIWIQDILIQLTKDGIRYRKGDVYAPKDLELSSAQIKLYNKALNAVEAFRQSLGDSVPS